MADNQASNQLTFADVQASVNQLVNDNTAQNNAIVSQIKEVQRLIEDFAAKAGGGTSPTQGEFQGVIAQLAAVSSLVQQNTAAIQATANAVQTADPVQPPSGSDTGNENSGIAGGINQGNSGPADQENSSSGTGRLGGDFE